MFHYSLVADYKICCYSACSKVDDYLNALNSGDIKVFGLTEVHHGSYISCFLVFVFVDGSKSTIIPTAPELGNIIMERGLQACQV
jgi:hypothetical protein